MSRPPRGSNTPQAKKQVAVDTQQEAFRETINSLKESNQGNSQAIAVGEKELDRHTNKILKILKEYTSVHGGGGKGGSDAGAGDSNRGAKTDKVCRVYGCIYKGTYDGIVDGLKAVREVEEAAKLAETQKQFRKDLAKGSVNALIKLPGVLHRGFVNLFAFERSEILNTWRAIRHSSALDANGQVDYQQRAFRLMLEKDSKKEKKKFDPNAVALSGNELLEQIRDNTGQGEQSGSLWWKKTETQISLLRDIKIGVGGQRRTFLMAMGLNFKRFGTVGRYQVTLLEQIRDLHKQRLTTSIPFWRRSESQIEILDDIRNALKPQEKESFWTKPISQLLFKPKARHKLTQDTAELQHIIADENQEQTDVLRDIHNVLDSKGAKIIPIKNKMTSFEKTNLHRLKEVHIANLDQVDAVSKLGSSLCNCLLSSDKSDDYQVAESTIGLEERERESRANVIAIRDNTGEMVNLLQAAVGSDIVQPKGLLESVKDKIEVAGNVSEALQGVDTVRDTLKGQKVFGKVDIGNKAKVKVVNFGTKALAQMKMTSGGRGGDSVIPGGKKKPGSKYGGQKKPGLLKRAVTKGKGIVGKTGGAALALGTTGLAGIKAAVGTGAITGAGGAIATSLAGTISAAIAAGLAGYGVGTLINKGIDSAVEKTTGGEAKSLGEQFYNFVHRKEIAAQKKQEEETKQKMDAFRARMAEKKKQESEAQRLVKFNISELDRAAGIKPEHLKSLMDAKLSSTALSTADLLKNGLTPEQIKQLKGMTKEEATKFLNGVKSLGDLTPNEVIDKIKSIDLSDLSKINLDSIMGAGVKGVSLAKGVAEQIVEKAKGIEVSSGLLRLMQKGEDTRIKLLTEMKEAIEWSSGSQTVQAMGRVVNDARSFATGGTTVNNVNLPVAAIDQDRNTNVMFREGSS